MDAELESAWDTAYRNSGEEEACAVLAQGMSCLGDGAVHRSVQAGQWENLLEQECLPNKALGGWVEIIFDRRPISGVCFIEGNIHT